MNLKDTRRAVLKSYIDRQFDGVARQFALAVEKPESQINDMLAGRKSFGEKVAHGMALKLNLPTDYFDKVKNIAPDIIENFVANSTRTDYRIDPILIVESIMREIDDEGRAEILGAARYIKFQHDQKTKNFNGHNGNQ